MGYHVFAGSSPPVHAPQVEPIEPRRYVSAAAEKLREERPSKWGHEVLKCDGGSEFLTGMALRHCCSGFRDSEGSLLDALSPLLSMPRQDMMLAYTILCRLL